MLGVSYLKGNITDMYDYYSIHVLYYTSLTTIARTTTTTS